MQSKKNYCNTICIFDHEEYRHVAERTGFHKKLDNLLKGSETRVLVGSFAHFWHIIMFKENQVVSKPPIMVKWKGGIWLWLKDAYVIMNFISNFGETFESTILGAFQSFPWNSFICSHLLAKVKHLRLKSPKLKGSHITRTLFKMVKSGAKFPTRTTNSWDFEKNSNVAVF